MNDSIIWTCIVFPINIFFEHSCFLAEQFLRKIFSTNASVFKIIHVLWPCYPLIIIFTLVCWVLVYHYLNTTFSFCECIVSALSECPHYANRLMCLRYRYGWQISEEYMFIIYFNACTSGKSGLLRVNFPSSTFHTCTVWFVIHILSQFNSCFYFSVHVLYDILFCILCCEQGRMKGMLFENLDHYFTNLFLQIYEIVHIYISLLKSIKSVDTKMSTEEYSESYATMY